MKIVHFSESYKPYLSGVTVALETLTRELQNAGHQSYIFAPAYPGQREIDPRVFRFPSLPAWGAPKYRIAIPYFSNTMQKVAKLKPEIIHSHSPFTLGRLALKIARKLKIPLVYTFHTLFAEYLHYVPLLPSLLTRPLLIRYLKKFCDQCDYVIVPTNQVKSILESYGVKSRIEVIPAGINLEAIQSAQNTGIREKYNIPEDRKLLIYVGRLSKEKNLPFLFEAYRKILAGSDQVHFMLVAGGPKRKELEELVRKLEIEKFVTFTGEIKPPAVFNYFKAGDIFVFSSTTETQGVVMGEARACGLPVVAVAASGSAEMLKNGEDGFLVPEDSELFAQKVLRLLQDNELRELMSQNARKNARNELSTPVCAQRLEQVYKSLK